jgi:GR25 family glycosyltransferase involved in LPS biosynthesis
MNTPNYPIDGILYINLEYREDRRKHIEKEIQQLIPLSNNIMRINAALHTTGAIGCAMSHIQALQTAKKKKWKNVLIIEDDLIFKKAIKGETETPIALLSKTLGSLGNCFDVLMISGKPTKLRKLNGHFSNLTHLSRATRVLQTSGYIVNYPYYEKLIEVFTQSYWNMKDSLETTGAPNIKTWAIDTNWFKLQKTDRWFIFQPTLGDQMESISDIETSFDERKTLFNF